MGDVAVNANQIPATVEVVCGNLRGTYDVAKAKVLYLSHLGGIREATPTEFERLGGRQATKKWKQSIRVVDTHGQPGKSLGEWLAGTAGTANEGTRAVWLAMGSAPQSGGHAQEPPARAQGLGGREQVQVQLLEFLHGAVDEPPEAAAHVELGSLVFDLRKLYSVVRSGGGHARVTERQGWDKVAQSMGLANMSANAPYACRTIYEHYLLRAERLESARIELGLPVLPPRPQQPISPTCSAEQTSQQPSGPQAAPSAAHPGLERAASGSAQHPGQHQLQQHRVEPPPIQRRSVGPVGGALGQLGGGGQGMAGLSRGGNGGGGGGGGYNDRDRDRDRRQDGGAGGGGGGRSMVGPGQGGLGRGGGGGIAPSLDLRLGGGGAGGGGLLALGTGGQAAERLLADAALEQQLAGLEALLLQQNVQGLLGAGGRLNAAMLPLGLADGSDVEGGAQGRRGGPNSMSLLPLDINDDQLLLAAGLGVGLQGGKVGNGALGLGGGMAGAGAGNAALSLLQLDAGLNLGGGLRGAGGGGGGGRQQRGLQLSEDGGGGNAAQRQLLQQQQQQQQQLLQLGGRLRQLQEQQQQEAMLVSLSSGPAGRLGLMAGDEAAAQLAMLQASADDAGLVSLAGGPVRSLALGRGGGGGGVGGGDLGVGALLGEAVHPGWAGGRRGGGNVGGGGGGGGGAGMQLPSGRGAVLGLGRQQAGLLAAAGEGMVDDATINSLLLEYVGGGGGGLGLLGRGGGGGAGMVTLKRGPPEGLDDMQPELRGGQLKRQALQ